jgi:hypothetical protein
MNSTDRDYDDLTLISGIANKRQQLLRQSLNIRTFLDLANLSIAEIEAAFKAKGQIVSRDTIEQWQRGARELAAAAQPAPQQVADLANIESGREANASPEEGEWEWFGAFIVDFRALKVGGQVKERQIRVEQRKIDKKGTWLEDNKIKNSIPIEGERLYQWMLEQLGEKAWPEPEQERLTQATSAEVPPAKPPSIEPSPVEVPPTELPPTETPRMRVEVTQIRAFQPPDIDTPSGIGEANQPFVGLLKSGEPFALEVAFRLPGPAAADLVTRETTYLANFYARKMATRISTSVGDTEVDRLAPGKVSYTARLPEVILQPGTYHLGVLVKLRTRPPSMNYLEAPRLEVV